MYAPLTSCFVIANPQWERGETTIRLIDLGRDDYFKVVPPASRHGELFDRLRRLACGPAADRAVTRPHVWQWGITDADLEAKLGELGFSLQQQWSLNPPDGADGFVNKTFVFGRMQSAAGN